MVSYLKIGHMDIPVKIIQEWRASTRVALGKDHVILRIPKIVFRNQLDKHVQWAENWLKQIQSQKPQALLRYISVRTYQHEDNITIGGKTFILHLEYHEKKIATIKLLDQNVLCISIPSTSGVDRQKVIKHVLSRFFCKFLLPLLRQRVVYFNDTYFNQKFQDIRLKYNKSNWGSCSRNRNLNFSVRLFLAPPEVLDYVIVHELAHLLEMNHSKKFWRIVENVMPDYKKYEKLLKTNSYQYDF
ncbi:MAG: M48 family metallopeptidase [Saprospiraceae bacterium]